MNLYNAFERRVVHKDVIELSVCGFCYHNDNLEIL